jgi:hypothetical protein
MLLAITSRVPEAKLLILRTSDRRKGVSETPSIFAQTIKSNVLNKLSGGTVLPPSIRLESVSAFHFSI